jgi:hypothetical protein
MGLSNGNLALLLAARHASGSEFKQIVTLGKMSFWPTKTFLTQILRFTDTSASAEKVLSNLNGDGSLFFSKYLHATYVDEIDASPSNTPRRCSARPNTGRSTPFGPLLAWMRHANGRLHSWIGTCISIATA